jgi:hypothetical protein
MWDETWDWTSSQRVVRASSTSIFSRWQRYCNHSEKAHSYPLLYSLAHYQERRKQGVDIRIRCVAPSRKYQAKSSELQSQGG